MLEEKILMKLLHSVTVRFISFLLLNFIVSFVSVQFFLWLYCYSCFRQIMSSKKTPMCSLLMVTVSFISFLLNFRVVSGLPRTFYSVCLGEFETIQIAWPTNDKIAHTRKGSRVVGAQPQSYNKQNV